MMDDFVWPSDMDRAENDELNRVCEYLEEVLDVHAQSGQGAEPVFWWDGDLSDLDDCVSKEQSAYHTIPLYTHPQPEGDDPIGYTTKRHIEGLRSGRESCQGIFLAQDERHTEPLYTHPPETGQSGEALARRFHEIYERLAPTFGYQTRDDTKQFDPKSANGRLMVAVCKEILGHPQPPQQGSVPEEWSYVVEVFLENVEEVTELLLSGGDADNIVALCNDLNKAAVVAEKVLATPPQPEADGWKPTLDWAVEKCRALQSQGFLNVLEKDFINAIEAHRPASQPPQEVV